MSEREFVTVEYSANGYRVVMTQEYVTRPNFGHYNFAIFQGQHIVSAGWSSGGPPKGRIESAWLEDKLSDYLRHQRVYEDGPIEVDAL